MSACPYCRSGEFLQVHVVFIDNPPLRVEKIAFRSREEAEKEITRLQILYPGLDCEIYHSGAELLPDDRVIVDDQVYKLDNNEAEIWDALREQALAKLSPEERVALLGHDPDDYA